MYVARLRDGRSKISVDDYIKKTNRPTADGLIAVAVECIVCGAELGLVEPGARKAHFAHKKDLRYCPTKKSSARGFEQLPPSRVDSEIGKKMRCDFRNHWPAHYHQLKLYAKHLSYDEFIAALKIAEEKRLFDRVGLREADIPCLLSLLIDFPPSTAYAPNGVQTRKEWYRFWLDRNALAQTDDLWIRHCNQLTLKKLLFKPPHGKRKVPYYDEDLLDTEDMKQVDFSTFLSSSPPMNKWIVKHVEDFLNSRPAFRVS
jgi:hypothetical protein